MGLFGDRARGRRRVPGARPAHAASRRRGPSASTVVLVLMLVTGAGIMAYPTFSDWWNSYHQSRAIAGYAQAVEALDPKVAEWMLEDAREYNEELFHNDNRYVMDDDQRAEYERLLDLDGTGVMGYIQMNSLGINYPIYHGVDESVLQVAIGHLEGTSLPVGGESTHAVVTGHRGLPSAKLFTDLDRAKEGDTFTITVLGQTLTYEVDQIRIVLPEEMSELGIEEGKDYVTLVTCTPYGVNTHRLLVRAHRVDNLPGTRVIPAEAVQIPSYIAVPAVGVPMLFVTLVSSLVYYRVVGHKHRNREAALSALKDARGGEGDE